ncbi:hypothetical protein GTF27_21575 [Roseobacter sp. HKCCD8507]|uniref:hypothetical protein n=1 Tax=Roseobacter sp. HKCCD8507 TaxID=2690580 RepID=UPI00149226F8|nr:hypothetical protein [Roseobacter sp. HKCCD8507]NOA05216.1 hypothetical protein [Roseobacter sp. HKCCD8507]
MRGFKKLVLTTTAIATLATAVSANIYTGQLTSYSDQQVLTYLVREHARDPSTFEDAHEYILLNRPAIMEDYLRRTLDRAPDTRSTPSSEPSVGETSGIGSVFVLGVVGIAAAASLAGGDGPGNSGPQPPGHHLLQDPAHHLIQSPIQAPTFPALTMLLTSEPGNSTETMACV